MLAFYCEEMLPLSNPKAGASTLINYLQLLIVCISMKATY